MDSAKIITFFLERNINLSPQVLDILVSVNIDKDNLTKIIENLSPSVSIFGVDEIKRVIEQKILDINDLLKDQLFPPKVEEPITEIDELPSKIVEEKTELEIKILQTPPKFFHIAPDVSLFRKLFNNRYNRLKELLLANNEQFKKYPVLPFTLSESQTFEDNRGILIGIVQETYTLTSRNYVIVLEDPKEGKTTNCIVNTWNEKYQEAKLIPRDSVIGIRGKLDEKYRYGQIKYFHVEEFLYPSLTSSMYPNKEETFPILVIGDLGIGSINFNKELFENVINHIKTDKDSVRAIIFVGNIIGNAIETTKEHNVNLKEEFSKIANLIKQFSKEINLLFISGQNDLSSFIFPQPPLDKKIAKSMYKLPNVKILGSPTYIEIEGIKILISNGMGIEEFCKNILHQQEVDYKEGIEKLLVLRLLATEYGSTIPFASIDFDYSVIDPLPNIFIFNSKNTYQNFEVKGIKVIAPSGFIGQKENKKLETIFPIIDIATGKISELKI